MTLNEYASRRTDITESDTVKERERERQRDRETERDFSNCNYRYIHMYLLLYCYIQGSIIYTNGFKRFFGLSSVCKYVSFF